LVDSFVCTKFEIKIILLLKKTKKDIRFSAPSPPLPEEIQVAPHLQSPMMHLYQESEISAILVREFGFRSRWIFLLLSSGCCSGIKGHLIKERWLEGSLLASLIMGQGKLKYLEIS
jgi:hypothetical protein